MITLEFLYPWLLLLLIPALLITLLPHFNLVKRFRRTRNRIIPLVLRIICFVLAITVLSGMTINYTIPNKGNEVLVLVDVSDNIPQEYVNKRENAVSNIVLGLQEDLKGAKLGIVTFGYDQKYVAPINTDVEEAYEEYLETSLSPDTSATNIAAAITYGSKLFTEEATWKKIIVVTDGRETDEVALNVIRKLVAEDSKLFIDIVDIGVEYEDFDAQITSVEMPKYRVEAGQECEIRVKVNSLEAANVLTLTMYDNDVVSPANGDKGYLEFTSNGSEYEIIFTHVFDQGGLHVLKFELTEPSGVAKNNVYTTYYYMDIFNKVLIYESVQGDSDALAELLKASDATPDGPYDVKIITTSTATYDQLPKTVNDYRQYDQVILNNIANSDLVTLDGVLYAGQYPAPTENDPTLDDFVGTTINMLEKYVYDYGGGMFTIGGDDIQGAQHAYDIEDLKESLLAKMLPVQVVDYTPPVGVMMIIDRSGSMTNDKLSAARQGAYAVLEALTERDYMGIMTLDSEYATVIEMTSILFKDRIRAAIDSIDKPEGGTVFPEAIRRAGQALQVMDNIQKRHIIIVTDGEPSGDEEDYLGYVRQYYRNNGTTFSVVLIGSSGTSKMQKLCDSAGGAAAGSKLYAVDNYDKLAGQLREDINTPAIKELEPAPFNPTISSMMSPLTAGFDTLEDYPNKMIAVVDGFYGVKARGKDSGAEVILKAEYDVPLYAQWQYGKGRVGSWMSDLKGSAGWSGEFMVDKDGVNFILRVISNLMPVESVRPSELAYEFTEDNYTNTLTIFNTFEKGEYVMANIYAPSLTGGQDQLVLSLNAKVSEEVDVATQDCYVTYNFTNSPEEYNSLYCSFVFKKAGVYRIDMVKYDANGVATDVKVSFFKEFAYSEEYITYEEEEQVLQLKQNLISIAERGNGAYVTNIDNTDELLNAEDTITKIFDPRILFMILTIIFMLIDIAVRKFKFKWPHEIIRERKQKKNLIKR